MASSSMVSSWLPPPGKYPVNIGSSLGRAIKNRKLKGSPAPTTKRSNLPERDFYSAKYNFRPSSIDATRPASLEIKKGVNEPNPLLAEYPSTIPGQVHPFTGTEQIAKEVDCILIYDEDTGQYTLEKLDSYLAFQSQRPRMVSPRPVESPPAATPASSVSSTKERTKQERYEMDVDASPADEDADGEVDDMEEVVPPSTAYREEEEEPEEGEEIEIPVRPVSPPKPKARAVKPMPKARVESKAPPVAQAPPAKAQPPPPPPAAVIPPVKRVSPPAPAPPAPKAKPQPKPKKAKPEALAPPPAAPTSYPDEEVIEISKPAKRARLSPPRQPPPAPVAAAPVSLSLPGGSSSFAPPPPPPSARVSASSRNEVPLPPVPQTVPSPQMAQSDSEDDEDDWEPVQTTATASASADAAREEVLDALEDEIFGDFIEEADDGSEEIDLNSFEKLIDDQLEGEGSEDDFVAAALSPEPEHRQPISLNRLASGAGAAPSYSDDDYSSSDESDED